MSYCRFSKKTYKPYPKEIPGMIIPTTVKGMWNPVINVINKRKAKGEQVEPDYRKYIKGEYGNIGNF